MLCRVLTHLDAPAEEVWSAVKRSSTLIHVTRGFLGFSGWDRMPEEWQPDSIFRTRFWFFHVLPAWWQHTMTVKAIDEHQRSIQSHEWGGVIKVWDHTIQVSPSSSGCDYSDEIEIDAGGLTIFVWSYANLFYRYRQLRWRRLARRLPWS